MACFPFPGKTWFLKTTRVGRPNLINRACCPAPPPSPPGSGCVTSLPVSPLWHGCSFDANGVLVRAPRAPRSPCRPVRRVEAGRGRVRHARCCCVPRSRARSILHGGAVTRVLLFCCGRAFRACKARGCPRGDKLTDYSFWQCVREYLGVWRGQCGGTVDSRQRALLA